MSTGTWQVCVLRQSLRNLTHEHESAVEPSIAQKNEAFSLMSSPKPNLHVENAGNLPAASVD